MNELGWVGYSYDDYIIDVCAYLMNLLPSLQVLGSYKCVVMEQHLGENDVGGVRNREVERRQTLGIFVVWAGTQVEQSAYGLSVVFDDSPVHGCATVPCSEVHDGPAIHQAYKHPGRLAFQTGG